MSEKQITKHSTVTRCIRNNVKDVRINHGLSQYALEKITKSIHPYIYLVEKQKNQPGIYRLARLCIALECIPEDLIYFDFDLVYKLIEEFKREDSSENKIN